MHRKYCLVPQCSNSSSKTPEKIFFTVPMNPKIREKWMKVMGRVNMLGPRTVAFCCEDHFDVEEDVDNYMKYKIMVLQEKQKMVMRLKPGVVPHKFQCQKEVAQSSPPREEKPLKTPDAIKKEPAFEQAADGHQSDPPVADSAHDNVVVKTELIVECPAFLDPLQTSPEHATAHQESWTPGAEARLSCHEEVSLPSSPPDIKEEIESGEYSQNEENMEEDYETIIMKMKKEVAELRNENQRLTEENQRLTEKNRNLSSGIEGLLQKTEHQVTNYENQSLSENPVIKKLGSEKLSLKEHNQRLSRTIGMFNKTSKKQAKTILDLTEKNQGLSERIDQLKQKLKDLTEERKSVRVTELKRRIRNLKQRIELLNKDKHDLSEEIEGLKLKNDKVMEQVEELPKVRRDRKAANKEPEETESHEEEMDSRNKRKRKLV